MKTFKEWYKEISGKEISNTILYNGNWLRQRVCPWQYLALAANLLFCSPAHTLMMKIISTVPVAWEQMIERRNQNESNWYYSPY